MPPALAVGASIAANVAGGAINRSSQNRAAKRASAQSAQDFSSFYDPLLGFGEQSRKRGQRQYGRGQKLQGEYEGGIREEIAGLGQDQFEDMAQADFRQTMDQFSPGVTSIGPAVGGRGFNPNQSGTGTREIGGFAKQLISGHADRLVGNRLNLAQMRMQAKDRLGGAAQYRTDLGIGLEGQWAGIQEGLAYDSPEGTLQYMQQGPGGGYRARMAGGAAQTQAGVKAINQKGRQQDRLRSAFTGGGGGPMGAMVRGGRYI